MSERDWGGPYIAAALFVNPDAVQSQLIDDGMTASIHGIGATMTISAIGDAVQTTLLIAINRGSRDGRFKLRLFTTAPNGEKGATFDIENDYNLTPGVTRLSIPVRLEDLVPGVYWVTIMSRGIVLTRVPLWVELGTPVPEVFLRA